MSSRNFQIWIKDNEGNRTQLKVTKEMEIKEIKELYIQTNPKLGDYRTLELFYNGNLLEDNKSLEELKIKNGKTFILLGINELTTHIIMYLIFIN